MNDDTVKFVENAYEDKLTAGVEVIKMGKLWGVFKDGQLAGSRAYHTKEQAQNYADELKPKAECK